MEEWREPNWGEFPDQVIPGLPLSQTSDGNYVASEVVPCVFLAAPHPQRHITPSATEEIKLDGQSPGALFPKQNLQALSFGRLDDGFDFRVN